MASRKIEKQRAKRKTPLMRAPKTCLSHSVNIYRSEEHERMRDQVKEGNSANLCSLPAEGVLVARLSGGQLDGVKGDDQRNDCIRIQSGSIL